MEALAESTVTAMTVAPDSGACQAVQPGGRRLVAGRYMLRSILGRGGMGLVWLADDELLSRPVALKQLVPDGIVPDRQRRAALLSALGEARTAARVHHNGAVAIYDLVKEDGCPWIVMEVLSGRSLAETIEADGPLPVDEVARLGLRLLDVLQATHRAGIIHRDVKPGNVHLCTGGRVVLTDFGIACAAPDGASAADHTFAGSPAYASPELYRGETAGPASDLFSLGATLFTAVEGRPPFATGDLLSTLTAVAEDAPAPLRRAGPLRAVIEGLLVKDPDRRLNADQARTALQAVRRRRASGSRRSGTRTRSAAPMSSG